MHAEADSMKLILLQGMISSFSQVLVQGFAEIDACEPDAVRALFLKSQLLINMEPIISGFIRSNTSVFSTALTNLVTEHTASDILEFSRRWKESHPQATYAELENAVSSYIREHLLQESPPVQ
jgi:hypothetical protein